MRSPGRTCFLARPGCSTCANAATRRWTTGSRHQDADRPSLKLEGASVVGYRSTFIGGIRDPILIGQIDEFLAGVRQAVTGAHPELADGTAQLHFHVYGRNGVMGELETSAAVPHEIGVLGEVTAPTQEKAKAIATITRVAVLHLSYPGQIATAGNLALPLSPMDNPIGPVCAFSVYHVIDAEGLDLFETTVSEVGARQKALA
jgi:hypothetical protein